MVLSTSLSVNSESPEETGRAQDVEGSQDCSAAGDKKRRSDEEPRGDETADRRGRAGATGSLSFSGSQHKPPSQEAFRVPSGYTVLRTCAAAVERPV